jgi:hypothetical protein
VIVAGMSRLFITLLPYLVLITGAVAIAASAAMPVPDQPVAVIFPPWWSAARAFAAAARLGAPIIRFGNISTIVVLQSDGAASLPARARAAGALLVVNALAFGGCVTPLQQQN